VVRSATAWQLVAEPVGVDEGAGAP
jgi:hypothetical protein